MTADAPAPPPVDPAPVASPAEWKERFDVSVRLRHEWDGHHYVKVGTVDTVVCRRCGAVVKELFTPSGTFPPLLGGSEFAGIICQACDVSAPDGRGSQSDACGDDADALMPDDVAGDESDACGDGQEPEDSR